MTDDVSEIQPGGDDSRLPAPDPDARCPSCGGTTFEVWYELHAAAVVDVRTAVVLEVTFVADGAPRWNAHIECTECESEFDVDDAPALFERAGAIGDYGKWPSKAEIV